MKKLILGLGLFGAMISSVFAQGLVSISLTGGLLVSTNATVYGGPTGKAYGNFRYELLISTNLSLPPQAADLLNNPQYLSSWVDSGVSGVAGSTSINAGKITSASSVAANGVPSPGSSYDNPFVMTVIGWSTDIGSTWSAVASAIQSGNIYYSSGYYGYTPMTTNVAGGGPTGLPTINLWGNQTGTPGYGINSALVLYPSSPLAYDFFIYAQPTNQAIPLGGNGTVSIGAGGAPINYQWRFNGTPLPGATNSFYQITNMGPANVGDYFVIMTNLNPLTAQTSQVAHVSIQLSPSISQQPTNQVFAAGTTASLTVGVLGDPPLSYQWRSITGPATLGTSSTLSFPSAQTNNSGSYFVIVTNTSGAVTSSPASLVVYQPAGIVTPPASQTQPYGAPATFSVVASGFPTLNYQWTLNGTNLPGATTTNLMINAVHLGDLGDYAVLVGNGYTSTQSVAATLTMSPSIIAPFTGTAAIAGQGAVLNVGAIGSGMLAYQWYKDGVAINGATNSTYTIPTLQLTDAGQYSVTVGSGFGSVTNSPAQLIVYPPADLSLGIYAGLTVKGAAGFTYGIQVSTNLANPNAWIDVTNITLVQSNQIWFDGSTDVRTNFNRYYRVKPSP